MIRPIERDVYFLGQKSEEATRDDLSIGQDLQDTLRANKDRCVGMASNMIGIKKRIIIVNLGFRNLVMYNPVIKKKSGSYEAEEGCLSLPGLSGEVKRPMQVTCKAFDIDMKPITIEAEGLLARCICHETDHLNGVLYKDHVVGELHRAGQLPEDAEEIEEGPLK